MTAAPHLPTEACDAHVHVFGPVAEFPFAALRSYTPREASVAALRSQLEATGFERVVLVQPSPYGADAACLLAALAELGPRARGVAPPPPDAATARRWHAAGVRAVRINVNGAAALGSLADRISTAARSAADLGWHLETNLRPAALVALAGDLARLPCALVLDHLALLPTQTFAEDPALAVVRRLLDAGRLWVKVSGLERLDGPPGPLVESLWRAAPERLVLGTDWPHTPFHGGIDRPDPPSDPFREVPFDALLRTITAATDGDLVTIAVRNPARLYGFPAA